MSLVKCPPLPQWSQSEGCLAVVSVVLVVCVVFVHISTDTSLRGIPFKYGCNIFDGYRPGVEQASRNKSVGPDLLEAEGIDKVRIPLINKATVYM